MTNFLTETSIDFPKNKSPQQMRNAKKNCVNNLFIQRHIASTLIPKFLHFVTVKSQWILLQCTLDRPSIKSKKNIF